ncbi:Hypothetical predicted protein [Mytilus galloprovincialis]|uniref:MYND-type domain-containing protein n=1 Tax=Mytilus galloprovincialis TaxID=29158 RepID=A0A8B6D4T5_MYTGA|nr:Hypothetical predicted protein [Mytilus galloprovincialis]
MLDHDYQQSNKNIANYIKFLWERLYLIQRVNTITEHTTAETKSSLSLLIPFINTNLASNISSIAIQHPNEHVRCFLLLGSLSYLIYGDLSGRLKFVSVLYAIGLYEDCHWFLEQEDEQYIKNRPSVCICSSTHFNLARIYNTHINTSEVFTCVSFFPSELQITPDAMQYEMFRCIGIRSQENQKSNVVYNCNYRAVVDCNIYFFLLKYLIKRKLRRYQETEHARLSIAELLFGTNVRHRDVACNVLTWMSCSDLMIPTALRFLKLSWLMMNSHNPVLPPAKEDMLQYQYNAAKLHALVLLYNTWFGKKLSSVHFCFQCFSYSQVKLLKCSGCKISTYCSKQCQSKNWKTHKAVCEIVRCYYST